MKNNILKQSVLLIFLLICNGVFAQWQTTSVTGVADIVQHNNNVYAASGPKILKLNSSTNEWEAITSTGRIGYNIPKMVSNGTSLFIVEQYQGCASSMVYRSDDNGATFVDDSAGLPIMPFCDKRIQNIYNIESANGSVIVSVAMGRFIKNPGDSRWTSINHNVKFSQQFADHIGTVYGYYQNFYKSTDTCKTWIQTSSEGLSLGATSSFLFVNKSSGRIYIGGGDKMYYSDNEGEKWEPIAIAQHLGQNWIGTEQSIFAANGVGNELYVGLDNDKSGTHPDILYSADNGSTFSFDTVGLPANAFVTTLPRKFLYANNVLYLALDQAGIFTKGTATSGVNNTMLSPVRVFPNPSDNRFTIQHSLPLKTVEVYTLEGKQVDGIELYEDLSVLDLPYSGFFILKITDVNNGQFIQRIIKN
jgi:photosystem II stability/assembly factor-like uncharacterized protein